MSFVVLIGLAAKNAVLIVEFATQQEEGGKDWGGAGAEMRRALGTAVSSGMLGVTILGLFLTPVFYVSLRRLSSWILGRRSPNTTEEHRGARRASVIAVVRSRRANSDRARCIENDLTARMHASKWDR